MGEVDLPTNTNTEGEQKLVVMVTNGHREF